MLYSRRSGIIMEKPILSPDFTIEDIHKIREQNYERTKNMTVAGKVAYYNNSGKEAEREIERRRALRRKIKEPLEKQAALMYNLLGSDRN